MYSKTHTELQCWEEYPSLMARSYHAVGRYQNLTRQIQKVRPDVHVYYGQTGTGKSRACMRGASGAEENELYGERDFYVMNTPASASHVPWINGYAGEDDVVLEDFTNQINYRILLRMLDQYPNKMQVKGGMVEFAPKRIWISSNQHPSGWYPLEKYAEGPLHRRLEVDGTGHLYKMTKRWTIPASD